MEYRPLADLAPAQQLFSFAAATFPAVDAVHLAWGAWRPGERQPGPEWTSSAPPERLVGALLMEREGTSAMLHGPVVVAAAQWREATAPSDDAPDAEREVASLDVAARLVATALEESALRGIETLFARPQGLDRIWIRYGFIPVPEGALPSPLRRRPGAGLFAYRGGSALWTFRESGSGARVAR